MALITSPLTSPLTSTLPLPAHRERPPASRLVRRARVRPTVVRPGPAALRFPDRSVVVVAGVPGAGKSTLLKRLYGTGADGAPATRGAYGVRVLDSDQDRQRLRPYLGALPYPLWRPLVHARFFLRLRRALRRGESVVVHEVATRRVVRRWMARTAARRGGEVHLVLLDVPADTALAGQRARGRRIHGRRFAGHVRRWSRLVGTARFEPDRLRTDAASVAVLDRAAADRVRRIEIGG